MRVRAAKRRVARARRVRHRGFLRQHHVAGTLSFASATIPKGGTALFALLALAGDVGCMSGPSAVGAIADGFGGSIQAGIAFGIFFPVVMFVAVALYREKKRTAASEEENVGDDAGKTEQ